MKERLLNIYHAFGLPRLIIGLFLLFLLIVALCTDLSVPGGLLSDSLVRIGQNAIFVLAMVPSIQAGTGLNFGLPAGIVCGMVGTLIAMELSLLNWGGGFVVALAVTVPLAVMVGFFIRPFVKPRSRAGNDGRDLCGFFSCRGYVHFFWLLAPPLRTPPL